jgi:hypothetical protein
LTLAEEMKRVILTVLVVAVALPAAFLLFMRFSVVRSEGYPTWEAVRNILIRDGEIVVTLPEGAKIISAQIDEPEGDVSIDGQIVSTKIGYSWCTISVEVEIEGQHQTIRFSPQKLNNWNRMRFEPVNPADPFSDFTKVENGVEKPNGDTRRSTTANKAAPTL